MRHLVAHYLPREMAVLGLIELAFSFAVIDTVIQTAGAYLPLPAVLDILPRGGIALALVLTLVAGVAALTVGLYHPMVGQDRKHLLLATGLTASVILAGLLMIDGRPAGGYGNVIYVAKVIAAWLATMSLLRVAHGFIVGQGPLTRRVMLVGDPRQVGALTVRLRSRRGRLFDPIVHQGDTVSWPMLHRQGIWRIVVASETKGPIADDLLDCKSHGMRILSGAAFQETYLGRVDLAALSPNDLLLGRDFASGWFSAMLKRLTDIVVGAVMLVLLLPLMAITALAIKIDSPGPIFYRQQRVGRFETTFTLFKFRSMTTDAEAGGPRWAQRQDPRITRVGRFIRTTRIDELPQLVNVIRGEMSMVGPRPERPHFVDQLARTIPFYRQRGCVKPGLTGWAQVNFPYGASVEDAGEKLAYDLYYVKHRSIMLDLFILISTIRVVLSREGAR